MSDKTTSGGGTVRLAALLGWLAILGGLGLIGYGVYALTQSDFGMAAGAPLMAGGAVTAALGLLALVNATMARAMIDTANNTANLLQASLNSGGDAPAATMASASGDVSDSPRGLGSAQPQGTLDDDLPSLDSRQPDAGATATDDGPDMPAFEPATTAAPAAYAPAIEPDRSDPRLWPLAVDEFDLDGHLAMTLEDGSIAVETQDGWCRLPSIEDARTWLAQQG